MSGRVRPVSQLRIAERVRPSLWANSAWLIFAARRSSLIRSAKKALLSQTLVISWLSTAGLFLLCSRGSNFLRPIYAAPPWILTVSILIDKHALVNSVFGNGVKKHQKKKQCLKRKLSVSIIIAVDVEPGRK